MAAQAIVSYDDTHNDHDALILGRVLAEAGAELTLAYVRHTTASSREREELEESEAQALLERGARWLEDLEVERRVVDEPLDRRRLEAARRAGGGGHRGVRLGLPHRRRARRAAVLGMEADRGRHRRRRRSHRPTTGPTASRRSGRIGILVTPGDDVAIENARELADRFDAVLSRDERQVDLLIVGSRAEAPDGRVMISSQAQSEIENATCPVLVLPRGVRIHFAAPIYVA